MLPGKKYKPEDLLAVLRRRYWLLIVPFAVVSAGTAVVARLLPDRYRSETLLLVVPQRVPEAYVRPTVTSRLEDRLQSIGQQILSRTRLERIIEEFNLYADERRTGIMEDIVDDMRLDIKLNVQEGDAFRLSYTGSDPRTVQQVTDKLATQFIDENLKDRELLADSTNQFLAGTADESRRRLIEMEKRLEEYNKLHAGELPSQLQSNLQTLHSTTQQIQGLIEANNRDGNQRLILERRLTDLESLAPSDAVPAMIPANPDGTPMITGVTAAQKLANARLILSALEKKYEAAHPTVKRWKGLIEDLEKERDAEALALPVSADSEPPAPPAELLRRRNVKETRDAIALIDKQMAKRQAEERALRGVAGEYQRRIAAAPARESDLIELNRDYKTLQSQYESLNSKKEESKIAANLERRQIGEQYRVLDPARVPEKPDSPNRPRINFLGMLAGLGLGIGLLALFEYRDGSFKTDAEVTTLLALPVLAVVPVMQSDDDRRRALKRRLIVGIGLGGVVCSCLAVVIYSFVS